MNSSTLIILMAVLNLIISALTVQAANIKISSLPFTITAPGTYVLTGNLTLASGNQAAINVVSNVPGPVVIDLKSFTITGPGTPGIETDGVLIGNAASINTYPITVRNGTISNCSSGISVVEQTEVTINNIIVNEPGFLANGVNVIGVCLASSNSSTVSNCTFIVPAADTGLTAFGIIDSQSTGGNNYNNNTFVNMPNSLYVTSWTSGGESPGRQTPPLSSVTLDHCQFAPPPSN